MMKPHRKAGWIAGLMPAMALAACTSATPPAAMPAPSANPPATMQYLYGSGEAGAVSIQAFRALLNYAGEQVKARPADSVVLAQGASLDAPAFAPCGQKPFAAIFDVDETLVLNLGFEYFDARTGQGFNDAIWDQWEKTGAGQVSPVPGAVYAVDALRAMGVTVIFNTNRAAANADATAQAIANAGLGKAVHGETLFLKGDDATGSKKDGRRWTIAGKYCVIALGGDQLGDFSDLFNQIASVPDRRQAAIRGVAAKMWGNGWFALPNPVYGSGLKGGFDDVFPAGKRWDPPAATDGK
ncbi:HAD family acid phosphatase [Sphingobium phenoxybenzoativorans]|uniref:HAD family acid phosphatase n=1 Tax=Sphingobium phenoxybenzoativorans TaxID=1592790 RepID=UPI0009F36C29